MSEKQEIFTLLDGHIKMVDSFYNPTSDAVWLAAYAPTNIKTALDVGVGTGGVALCLLLRNPQMKLTGLDISKEMLDVCRANMALNNAEMDLIENDIFKWSTTERFDLVITNPPYFNGTPAKHNAHHNTDIEKWIKRCCARVNPNGYICTIADSLCVSKIIATLEDKHFGDVQIFPLFGGKNSAERVLIRARQGVKTGASLFVGTSMNNNLILRDGLTIDRLLATLHGL